MRDKLKIRYVVLIVLLSVVWATQLIPILGEVYAQSVYPVISHFLSSFSKLMPFAIGDLFIFLSVLGLLFNPIRARYIQKKKVIRASRMVEDMPTLFRILYCCGLRPGEVLHLEVGDVDLKKGVLLVRASKNDNDR